jgi:multiple sugar transport system permease protein
MALLATFSLRAGEMVEHGSHSGDKTTISYAMWGGKTEIENSRRILARFVEEFPHLRVSVAVYPWGQYWAKLQTQAASGLAPDVISLYSKNQGVWISRGALLPMDELVKSSRLDLSAYHEAAIENCTWQGKLFCFPIEIALRTLVFSTDRLEESGIPREEWPRADKALNWEEFLKLCRRLTLRNPDGTFRQYGFAVGYDFNQTLLRMRGGEIFDRLVDPSCPNIVGNAALEEGLRDLFLPQYGERCMLGEVPLSSGAFMSADSILLSSRVALGTTGPWALVQLTQSGVRFGLSPMPRNTHPSQLIGVNSLGIFSASKHPHEAWELIRFMASGKIQPLFGKSLKGVPALKAARDSIVKNDLGIKGCEAFLHDLPIAKPNLSCANSYVPAALDKWLAQLERRLDEEYDSRLSALPRENGNIAPGEHEEFSQGMNDFVGAEVSRRLPRLDAELRIAFARSVKPNLGLFELYVLPVLLVLLLAALAAAYLNWVKKQERKKHYGRPARDWIGYAFLAPWLAGFALFVAGPVLCAGVLSFTDWNMIRPPEWVGVSNYRELLGDERFWLGIKTTTLYALCVIPLSLGGGLFTAGLLTCNIRGRDALKAIFYFPSLFTGAAAAALWVNLFHREYGVVNYALSFLGINPVNWLGESHAFLTVILMNLFWVGGAMIVYYAGMKQVPQSLYEAAEIDGAGALKKFTAITIPLLSPVILFMVVMTTIGAFQIFTPALFFATDSTKIGSPGDSLRFYSVNIYDEAFNNLRMGRACGYAIILFLIIFAITMAQMKLSRLFVHSEIDSRED